MRKSAAEVQEDQFLCVLAAEKEEYNTAQHTLEDYEDLEDDFGDTDILTLLLLKWVKVLLQMLF